MPTTPVEAFAFVEKLAKKLGICIEKLCKDAGVSPSTVYYWRHKDELQVYNTAVIAKINAAAKKVRK